MAYKYLTAEQHIQLSPKEEYIGYFQETINEQFYNASNVFTIQEETAFASGVYQNIDVRIVHTVDTETGERVGDDFKTLLFKDITHSVDLGMMYKFDDNFWITVNVEKIKTLMNSVTVRRCNNVLRWLDVNGGIHEVPCSIGYLIKENRDYSTAGSSLVIPSGMIEVQVQMNNETKTLKANQRFLFGNSNNWTSYRIEGGGVRNYNNLKTFDNSSAGLILFSMSVDYTGEHNDDLINGIADGNQFIYSLSLNQSSISGSAGQTVQLEAVVKLNNDVVSRNVVWASSNPAVASVSSAGLVTFVSEGTSTITCNLLNNSSINDTCVATGVLAPVDNYQVIFSPTTNYIFENEERIWTAYLYKNGIQQVDTFVFVLNPNSVPSSKYIYTVLGGNSFKIHNYGMFLEDVLEITATSGIHSRVLNVTLRGAW